MSLNSYLSLGIRILDRGWLVISGEHAHYGPGGGWWCGGPRTLDVLPLTSPFLGVWEVIYHALLSSISEKNPILQGWRKFLPSSVFLTSFSSQRRWITIASLSSEAPSKNHTQISKALTLTSLKTSPTLPIFPNLRSRPL